MQMYFSLSQSLSFTIKYFLFLKIKLIYIKHQTNHGRWNYVSQAPSEYNEVKILSPCHID